MCVGKTYRWIVALNFGEILKEFGEILGKYRILDGRSPGSIGLKYDNMYCHGFIHVEYFHICPTLNQTDVSFSGFMNQICIYTIKNSYA